MVVFIDHPVVQQQILLSTWKHKSNIISHHKYIIGDFNNLRFIYEIKTKNWHNVLSQTNDNAACNFIFKNCFQYMIWAKGNDVKETCMDNNWNIDIYQKKERFFKGYLTGLTDV